MSKKIEKQFLDYWNDRFPNLQAVMEYKPQEAFWETCGTDLKYLDWIKASPYRDFRGDFAIIKTDNKLGLLAEFDGAGGSHESLTGIQRDRVKGNQGLKFGYITVRFPVKTVKANMAYVADEILEIYEVWSNIIGA